MKHPTIGLKKIRSKGELANKAYKQLKQAIVRGHLSPGMRLQEELFTEKLGISRTPFREALNRLNSEGLIQIVPKKGAHVVELSSKELDDLFEAREVIETHFLIRSAQTISPIKFAEFKQRFQEKEEELAEAQGNYEEWDLKRQEYLRIDRELHDILITGTDNDYWEQLYVNIRNRVELYGSYLSHDAYWFPVAIKEHHEILDAIIAREFEKAQHVMSTHIKHVRQGLSESNVLRT